MTADALRRARAGSRRVVLVVLALAGGGLFVPTLAACSNSILGNAAEVAYDAVTNTSKPTPTPPS